MNGVQLLQHVHQTMGPVSSVIVTVDPESIFPEHTFPVIQKGVPHFLDKLLTFVQTVFGKTTEIPRHKIAVL